MIIHLIRFLSIYSNKYFDFISKMRLQKKKNKIKQRILLYNTGRLFNAKTLIVFSESIDIFLFEWFEIGTRSSQISHYRHFFSCSYFMVGADTTAGLCDSTMITLYTSLHGQRITIANDLMLFTCQNFPFSNFCHLF